MLIEIPPPVPPSPLAPRQRGAGASGWNRGRILPCGPAAAGGAPHVPSTPLLRTPRLETRDFSGSFWLTAGENKGRRLFTYFLKCVSSEDWAACRKGGQNILVIRMQGYLKCWGRAILLNRSTAPLQDGNRGCPGWVSGTSTPPLLLLRCTCALNGPGERQLVKTLQFPPAWFVFREIANEDTLIQARCVGVLCMYVGKMDQAHKLILQRTSSQHKVMISSHYRPQTRLLSPDDSKLKRGCAMPADTWALWGV